MEELLPKVGCLVDCDSALSSDVQRIVSETFYGETATDEPCIVELENGLFDFSALSRTLFIRNDIELESLYICLPHLARSLLPFIDAAHRYVSRAKMADLSAQILPFLRWTGNEKVFQHCIQFVSSANSDCSLLCLLIWTASLERALGDVYVSISGASHCPTLFKDLLCTTELEQTFGKPTMHCLKAIVGSPTGFNLRNIAWHGFLSAAELQSQFVSFLLILIASLGRVLERSEMTKQIHHRDLVSYVDKVDLVSNAIPPLHEMETESLISVIRNSEIFPLRFKDTFVYSIGLLKSESHWICTVLLLPQLEHILRRFYAVVNDCSERVLTAKILNPMVTDTKPNQLLSTLNPAQLRQIFDLLTYPEGLRLRDKLSHGQVDVLSLPVQLTNFVVAILVSICYQWIPNAVKLSSQCSVSSVDAIIASTDNYKVLFHPIAFLKRQIASAVLEDKRLQQVEMSDDSSAYSSSCVDGDTLIACVLNACPHRLEAVRLCALDIKITQNKQICDLVGVDCIVDWLTSADLPSLCSTREVLEVVRILRKMMHHWSCVVAQIVHFGKQRLNEWNRKELRSRQRRNYESFCKSFPTLCLLLHCLLLHVCLYVCLILVDWIPDVDSIRYVKKSLQCAERLHIHTSSSANKWQEASSLLTVFHELLERQIQKHKGKGDI